MATGNCRNNREGGIDDGSDLAGLVTAQDSIGDGSDLAGLVTAPDVNLPFNENGLGEDLCPVRCFTTELALYIST